ncbi:DUF4239 domain-containing protein [Roseomonas terrae]|jgi:hypothetical protein|uniref:DUF4239 domain-containing protein n=1 Tax=Neoroseomonas terrae TaxID=424799 RepID=A0ABS5EIT1_9PROT|nr:hypothetical protein [Neoroseomonas terrae]MBR0650935.1 DUF4239 domain-containing protein [Neoroseomonas terrae]
MTLLVSAGVFVITLVAGLIGLGLHGRLPEHHRGNESKDVVRLVQALIASIATLVLSLLIASASSHFRDQADSVSVLAADILVLDAALAQAGPDADRARSALRGMVAAAVDGHAIDRRFDGTPIEPATMDAFYNAIAALQTTNAAQHAAQQQALGMAGRLVQARATLMVRSLTDGTQWPFLTVLVAWLCILFLAMGLFVRANTMVVLALAAGAIAVAGAIFLILELGDPHAGLLRISDAPLRLALRYLN